MDRKADMDKGMSAEERAQKLYQDMEKRDTLVHRLTGMEARKMITDALKANRREALQEAANLVEESDYYLRANTVKAIRALIEEA